MEGEQILHPSRFSLSIRRYHLTLNTGIDGQTLGFVGRGFAFGVKSWSLMRLMFWFHSKYLVQKSYIEDAKGKGKEKKKREEEEVVWSKVL